MAGIKLKFDQNGSAKTTNEDGNECFGGVICVHAQHTTEEFYLEDGTKIVTHPIICNYRNKPIVEFNNGCPLGYWIKLAVPIGWQNLTFEERIKWRKK